MNAKIYWLDNDDDLEAASDDVEKTDQLNAPTTGGFIPLGMAAGSLTVVFSLLQKRVFKFKPSELRGLSLEVALGADWCKFRLAQLEATMSAKTGKSPAALLASSIIRDCQAAGPYREAQERRAGVWLDTDGELIISGNKVWRPSDGTVLEHGIHGGNVYPAIKWSGFDQDTPMATTEDIQRTLAVLRSFEWSTPLAAEMILGWIGIAVVAAAARRRPHVLITGPAGCGKSTLIEQVGWLLGEGAVCCTGAPTLMGLNQLLLNRPSAAVVIDEFEADGRSSRSKQTFEVARSAYSLQEGDAGVVRGTPGGTVASYRVAAPFLAAGISPGRLEPADQSRWLVLEAQRLAAPKQNRQALFTEAEAMELGPRLARLFVQRWATFNGNLNVMKQAIRLQGGDARLSDTLGYLLAAYAAFRDEAVISQEEATAMASAAEVSKRADGQVIHDEQECLTRVLSFVTTFQLREGLRDVKRTLPIGQAIRRLAELGPSARLIAARLAQLGLRVRQTNSGWVLMIANSPSHAGLSKVFAGTKWSNGGWPVVLRRLPGGTESTQRLSAGMPACKVTIFDLPAELVPIAKVSATTA